MQNVCRSAVFKGGRPLCTQIILPAQGCSPATILGISKLPDGEDRIPLRSLVMTQYRSVKEGRTDKRTRTDLP